MWQERTSKPKKTDEFISFYNNRYAGGKSKVITGKPTDPEANVLANCVGYANGRFNEIYSQVTGRKEMAFPTLTANAENFIEKAKNLNLKVGNIPQIGAIVCWQKGNTLLSSDGAGHVAVIEKVLSSSKITTSESGWESNTPFWTKTRSNTLKNWGQSLLYKFRGFIYNPCFYSNPYTQPTRTLQLKSNRMIGEDIKWLQYQLNEKGYNLEIDGVFGPATKAATADYQKRRNIAVDGVCGIDTRTELMRPF